MRAKLLILLVYLSARGAAQALAGDLDLSGAEGRVDACEAPLVAHNDSCTCDAGAQWQGGQCAPCAAGYYKTSPGLHACSACPALTTSFEGATEADDCLCVPGYSSAAGACAPCAVGAYKDFIGNSSCVVCPANADTSNTAADSLNDCLCNAGYVSSIDGDEACAACAQNTFTIQRGSFSCVPCPEHSGTEGPASTFVDCKCQAGYTQGGYGESFCVACAAGKYKAALSMTACTQCPADMFGPVGASALANCTCNAGFEKLDPSACAPCAANAYCPGTDVKLACPGNSTAPRGSASIDACLCLPGFFWYFDTCELCSADSYCANNTRTPCPANSTAPVASASIHNCTCLPGFQ